MCFKLLVYLDGKKIEESKDQHQIIVQHLKEKNLVVSSLSVNDVEMINTPLEEIFNCSNKSQVIKIETSPALQFSMEALEMAKDYIPKLKDGLLSLRELVFEGKIEKTKILIDEALEGLEWVILTFQAAASQTNNEMANKFLAEEMSKITGIFKELEPALKREDMTLICDLFEYELVPFLEKAIELIPHIKIKAGHETD